MPLFNSSAFIVTQLRFIIAMIMCMTVFSLIARIVTLLWLAPSEVFSEYTGDLFSTFVYSIRWDLKVLSIFYVPAFLIALVTGWHKHLQKIGGVLIKAHILILTLLFIILTLGNILYWHTYSNPLDFFAFGLFEDDTTEVLKVLWNDYHPILFTAFLMSLSLGIYVCANKLSQSLSRFVPYFSKWYLNAPINVSYFIIFLIIARGSFSLFPLTHKTTLASNMDFLNLLAINAPAHLEQAIKRKRQSTFSTSSEQSLLNSGFKNITQASDALLFKGEPTNFGVPLVIDSQSNNTNPAPNIIFVLMEGWSSQIVFDNHQPENFLGEFKQHIPKGLLYKNFVSTRQGTLRFLESTLANTSFFNLSTSVASNLPFKYSNVATMKNMGLELGFIRGGSRLWYNQGNFWKAQGFDHYWDMSDIMKQYNVDKFSDWGVHDEFGFKFALEKIQDFNKNTKPYFLLVETTTNHPPHVLPKTYNNIDAQSDHFLQNAINQKNTALQVHTTQYMTEQLGQFLTNLENENLLNNTIVIATGDHTLWAFYNYGKTQDRLLAGSVPLYMRIPASLKPNWSDETINGSHRDIFPTIFELAYPKARYLKTGFDLFDPQSMHAGWHEKDLWIMDNMVSIDSSDSIYRFDEHLKVDTNSKIQSDKLSDYKRHISALEALIQFQFKKEFEQSQAKKIFD